MKGFLGNDIGKDDFDVAQVLPHRILDSPCGTNWRRMGNNLMWLGTHHKPFKITKLQLQPDTFVKVQHRHQIQFEGAGMRLPKRSSYLLREGLEEEVENKKEVKFASGYQKW